MRAQNQATLPYVIPGDSVASIAKATTSNGGRATLSDDAEAVISAIKQGRRVQAMTTLNNGNVVFALSGSVGQAVGNG